MSDEKEPSLDQLKWSDFGHPRVQSAAPTPETDAMQRIQFEGCTCVVAAPEDIELLESQRNEAMAERDEIRHFHDGAMMDAYAKLGIDGSDGEYRYKWVSLGIHKLKTELAAAKERIEKDEEPTPEMILAAMSAHRKWENNELTGEYWGIIYKAMMGARK